MSPTKVCPKKILVTGSTGFIGSNLIPILRKIGHKVYKLERYVTGRIGRVSPYPEDTYFADLKDIYALMNAIESIKPNIVIHLGAMTAVAYSYAHPQDTIETNFLGTVNLAEICTKVSCIEQFIFASSAEIYGVLDKKIKVESDTNVIPNTPYAVSKYAAEKYLDYLHKAYNFPVTVFRPFNSYGRKKNTWFIVEKTINQMLKGQECRLGDPVPVRDFVYLDDQLTAYVHSIGNPDAIGETFNISTGVGVSIKELTDIISDLTDFRKEVIWDTMPNRPLDIVSLIGSNEKIRRILKVPNPIPLEEGLTLTIDYWRDKIESGT